MKKFILLSSLAMATLGTVNAQNATASQQSSTKTEFPQVRAKRMVTQVNTVCYLHGDQFSKVNAAFVDYYTKLDKGGDATSLKAAVDAALKTSLDAQQYQQWNCSKENKY